ncbi:MAG: acetylglutamate kinase [Chitinispirillales bacterium]|jgi:acetylglutamate kinase|nr:acetylglutamate kinase [Chitinispirillales bacterium]
MAGTAVIKIGGSTVDTPGLLEEFAESVKGFFKSYLPIVVHGGGKDIARQLDKLNKESVFVEGMRVTDAESVRVVQMVLSGDVNKRIVHELVKKDVPALGLSGVDGGLLTAEKLLVNGRDIGFVGEIRGGVRGGIILALFSAGYIPVISPVSPGTNGEIFNVNADSAAGEVAKAMTVGDLIFISDVPGVKTGGSVRKVIRISEIECLIDSGDVTGGMIPKLRSAAAAVEAGVARVHICGWHGPTTLMDETDEEKAKGTTILK